MVIDTSAIMAVFFNEESADWVLDQLSDHASRLRMSTVNLTECLILIRDRQPSLAESLEARLLASGIQFEPPDIEQAQLAAAARFRWPLNLGDCFAYALARRNESPLLTLDRDFRRVDIEVVLPE